MCRYVSVCLSFCLCVSVQQSVHLSVCLWGGFFVLIRAFFLGHLSLAHPSYECCSIGLTVSLCLRLFLGLLLLAKMSRSANLRRGLNLQILKNQDCRHFENWSLPIFKMSGKLGSVSKPFGKSTPMRRLRRRHRALPRPGMGVDFPNVLKTDPNFQGILAMGRLQFSKCLQSWFFRKSRFRPRRKFPPEWSK